MTGVIMKDFLERYRDKLEKFTFISQSAGVRNDYVQGGGGNTSVKLDDSLMAIKASGYCLSDIKPDKAYAVLDYSALRGFYYGNESSSFEDVEKSGSEKAKQATISIEGIDSLRPSVEAGFHSLLDTYVLHSHSVYANLASCSREGREIIKDALSGSGYAWGFVGYTDPGARLTFSIRDEISRVRSCTGKDPSVIFMENHGLIVHSGDADECLGIHSGVNAKAAAAFGITGESFPRVSVKEYGDMLISDSPYLEDSIRTGKYGPLQLCEDALYPDQLVFLTGTLYFGKQEERPENNTCIADFKTGKVVFNMQKSRAQTITETLTAIIFIREIIAKNNLTLITMGDAAKNFISNWESEKYRKSLAGK
jgi:ribulose-5-phosphate 4-epimerase/fuculose-1-phosphate aldolase